MLKDSVILTIRIFILLVQKLQRASMRLSIQLLRESSRKERLLIMGRMRISGGTGVTMIKGMTMLGGRAIIHTGTSKRKKMIPVVKNFLLWV
jgi:hypothetical protein